MHGRVKVRTTAEQEKLKQAERQRKSAEFKKGVELVFQKRKNKELDDELLLVTEKLLLRNPDVYTLWNIRREAFLNNNWSNEEYTTKLEKELNLIENSLRENPKSYCVWHQRTWIMERLPNPNWKRELDLCNRCLNLDERNFHCWDYRRFVVSKSNVPDVNELKFTTSKITNNFSNYSSWHYRSKLLQKLYSSDIPDLPITDDKYNEELDLVINATFTDPNDSSTWFYHRWLLDYWKSPNKLLRAVLTETRITVAFCKEVPLSLELFLNGKTVECEWKSANEKRFSMVWYAVFTKLSFDNLEELSLKFEENYYKFKPSDTGNEWIYNDNVKMVNPNICKLQEQLENYQMLSKMEPTNKWAKLTSVYLMLNIDPIKSNSNIIQELNDLIKIDPLRTNFYKDMRSKCVIEFVLNTDAEKKERDMPLDINLSGRELTTLSSQEPYLAFYQTINLSNNCLGNRLYQLHILQVCNKLDLSNNGITSLKTFPTLHALETLSLSDNQLMHPDEVLHLIKRHNLKILNLKGNPILNINSLVNDIKNNYMDLQVVF